MNLQATKALSLLAILLLTACAPGVCNDTNEDWPGVPKCTKHYDAGDAYEAFIERCEAKGGKYRVGQDFEPICNLP
jgi:hypothetical protein